MDVKIVEASREFSKKETINLKLLTRIIPIDAEETLEIEVADYAVLDIHNELAENPDYTKYIIIAKDGTMYSTGSEAFWSTFMVIFEEMHGEPDFVIRTTKQDSRNRPGKYFLSCELV